MAKETYTVAQLQEMEVTELRKVAKSLGLSNYLRATEDDLRDRITEALELEDEPAEEAEENEEESSTEEEMEEESFDDSAESEEEEEEEEESAQQQEEESVEDVSESEQATEEPEKKEKAPKAKEKTEKSAKKEKAAKVEGVPSKSDNVRSIVNEYLVSGRAFSSGKIMIELRDRFNQDIHRSFVSAIISKCREDFEEKKK